MRGNDLVAWHGDFHPLKFLVPDDGHAGLVDWTAVCIADRHHEVECTLARYWLAALVAPMARFGPRLLGD